MANQAYAVVVYKMKEGEDERQPVYSEDELMYEKESAERELRDRDSHVAGYHIESPKAGE